MVDAKFVCVLGLTLSGLVCWIPLVARSSLTGGGCVAGVEFLLMMVDVLPFVGGLSDIH